MDIRKDRICVIGICALVTAAIICIIAVHAAGSTGANDGTKNDLESQTTRLPRDCSDVFSSGNRTSGVYLIHIRTPQRMYERDLNIPAYVYCDMDMDGGAWTLLQRRVNGLVDFYRYWEDYKAGFGYVNGDHWLGLQNLHWMTSTGLYEFRVDLEDFDGNIFYAKYASFKIGDERLFYKLYLGDFEGTAANLLQHNNYHGFSTEDEDHDSDSSNCARDRQGAWWYISTCGESNLNGAYLGPERYDERGMGLYGEFGARNWKVLKKSEMKIRRIG